MSALQTYSDYIDQLKAVLDGLNMDELKAATEVLEKAFENDNTIFVAGNGGSAATASHMACDFCKTTLGKSPLTVERRLRSISLSDNMPLVTAYGNDTDFNDVFAEQLKTWARAGDVLIVITCSGNSPNILRAIEVAKQIGVTTIGFLGFAGGKSKAILDYSILAESTNYGVIEDAHAIFMHMLTEHMKIVVASGQPVAAIG